MSALRRLRHAIPHPYAAARRLLYALSMRAAVAFVVLAAFLTACRFETDAPIAVDYPDAATPDAATPDAEPILGGNDCGCPAPDALEVPCTEPVPAGGCSLDQCLPSNPAYGSCSGDLYECNAEGFWRWIGGCEPIPLHVDGVWDLNVTLDGADPCPELGRVDHQVLKAVRTAGPYELRSLDNRPLASASVDEGWHSGSTTTFTLPETWTHGAATFTAPVSFDLHFDWNNHIDGRAEASITRDALTCNYAFTVTGSFTH